LYTLYSKRGTVNHALSNFTQSADDFTKALEQAQTLKDLERQAAALNSLTMTLFFAHRLDETLTRAAEALDVAELAGSEKLRADTMLMIGLKHACYGGLKEGKAILDEVIESARRLDYKPALLGGLTWRACLHFFQSEYELAVTKAQEGIRLASELRDGFLMLTAMFFVGLSQGNQGKMSAALATLQEAMEKARRNGDLFWFPRFPNCIGWIYRELHDFETARKFNEDGVDVARRHHVLEAEANSLINRGIDCTHAGQRHCTDEAFAEVKNIFARDAWFRWRYNIRLQAATAVHHLREGELDQARESIVRLEETAREHEVHKYIAVANQLMAELLVASGDLASAEDRFNAALEELKEFPAPLVAWKVHAGIARLKAKSGDAAGAEEHSSRAFEFVNSIAANVDDEVLRQNFLTAAHAAITG
jgi:tetratricopeptide (TPR) repeat protein